MPLLSARPTSGIGGGVSLPTLTVKGVYRNEKQSKKAGDGIINALRKLPTLTLADGQGKTTANMTYKGGNATLPRALAHLPTLCATDYKSPYSAEGCQQQTQKRSKPLRDTLKHTTGNRLGQNFAEWYMGFPINYTASAHWVTRKSRK